MTEDCSTIIPFSDVADVADLCSLCRSHDEVLSKLGKRNVEKLGMQSRIMFDHFCSMLERGFSVYSDSLAPQALISTKIVSHLFRLNCGCYTEQ